MKSVENNCCTNINFMDYTDRLTFILWWNKGDYDILSTRMGDGRQRIHAECRRRNLLESGHLREDGEIGGKKT
jgi:hypothetical protein